MPVESLAKPRCLLVLGMHRSGTSTVTRCLNLAGMDVGPHLLGPDGGNSKGYWEHADAVRINDALLASLGLIWWSLDPLPKAWLTSPGATTARAEIQALVLRDFAGVPLWGIKDPRMCRLAPLWIDVVGGMGIDVAAVFVARSPVEVARSLHRAHGLSEEACVLSWLQHTAESERATRDLRRTMVSYDRVLGEPVDMLDGIGADLGISWAVAPAKLGAALERFVDKGLRTQKSASPDQDRLPLVGRMARACESLASGTCGGDWSQLSCLSDEAAELFDVLAWRARGLLPDEAERAHRADRAEREQAHATLYRARRDEDFSEQNAIVRLVPFGRVQLSFELVEGSSGKLRLDPTDRAGYYRFHALTVVDAEGLVLWNWAEAAGDVTLVGIERIDRMPGVDAFYRVGDDPQMHLAWLGEILRRAHALTLDMERLDERRLAQEFDAWRVVSEQDERSLREEMRTLRDTAEERECHLREEIRAGRVASEEREFRLREEMRAAEAGRIASAEIQQQLAAIARTQLRQAEMTQALLRRGLWSRLRRRFARTKFRMYPRHDLELLDAAADRYRVTGDDPIIACESDNFPLAAGWYFVTLHMEQHAGLTAQPCLYPDYDSDVPCGPAGESMLFVRPGRSVHHGLMRFVRPVKALRLDPAISPCEISVSQLVIKRVGKVRAAWELFKAWRRPLETLGKLRPPWRTIRDRFLTSGLVGGMVGLFEWYTTGDPRVNSYDAWLARYDDASPAARQAATVRSGRWSYRPLISILLPTYNTDEQWLRRCVESVFAQSYPHWELCVADDASPKAHVMNVLNEYAAKDQRVRVERRGRNGHISANSNTALRMAEGEYIALLDHDDELHPLALHEVVAALQQHPQWKLIYSDEDKIDEQGRRSDPYMKPNWNYDLFLSQNCISHLGVYQRQLVLDVGGFREGFEGSQDWDLALRCIEKLKAEEIGHIPRVLYHWRAIPGSTAGGVGEKNYARAAGMRAVTEHLARIGADASVREHGDARLKGHLHVNYRLPVVQPTVSLIIPTRDGLHLLKRCIDSILALTDYDNYEIVIVDNQSSQSETLDYLRTVVADPRVRVLAYDRPFNYSALNNHAVRQTSSELVGLVNNDIEVISPGWLREMAGHAMRPEIGAVGAMLYYPNDTIQHAGVVLGLGGVAGHVHGSHPRGYVGQMGRAQLTQNLSAVTAACLLVRRSVFDEAGGLDESLSVAFNDVDFCLRIRRLGYRNLWTPLAELYHHESATRGYEDSPKKKARFAGEVERMQMTWGDELITDPAYNPNLTLTGTPFELAFPPRTIC
ncbi:MAG TPA: glycosyltransferase [Xanthomonadaceae bacterium]|nr:glycosyltransferase [Xanthomonadaceae bacterium]